MTRDIVLQKSRAAELAAQRLQAALCSGAVSHDQARQVAALEVASCRAQDAMNQAIDAWLAGKP